MRDWVRDEDEEDDRPLWMGFIVFAGVHIVGLIAMVAELIW